MVSDTDDDVQQLGEVGQSAFASLALALRYPGTVIVAGDNHVTCLHCESHETMVRVATRYADTGADVIIASTYQPLRGRN